MKKLLASCLLLGSSMSVLVPGHAQAEDKPMFGNQTGFNGDFVCLYIPFNMMAENRMEQVLKDKGYSHMTNPQVVTNGANMFLCGLVPEKK